MTPEKKKIANDMEPLSESKSTAQNSSVEEQQALFASIVNSSDDAILSKTLDGIITTWNHGAEKVFGYAANEIIGRSISILIPPHLQSEEIEIMKKIRNGEKVDHYETERVRKDGKTIFVSLTISPIKDANGNIIGAAKISRDITQKKKIEQELSQSLKEVSDYKYALEQSAIVAITDQKGVITYANDNFCKISKYSREELIGKDHRIINSGHHSKEFIRELWVTIAKGKIWKGELKNKAKDGTVYWVDTTIVPFLNEQGKPYQYVAIRADITQRKKGEEEIRSMNEELEKKIEDRTLMLRETLIQLETSKNELSESLEKEKELSELKTRFVSTVSHEFRTPLASVLSSAALIGKYTKEEEQPKRDRHVARIKEGVKHLSIMLEDLLSLGKLEEGLIEAKTEMVHVAYFMEDFLSEMKELIKPGQEIKFTQSGNEEIVTDKRLLKNILLNLVSNAIKFSPEDSVIEISCSNKGEQVVLSVKDSGIGISKEDQQHLFERFFRARNASNIQGTGLGLHIVSKYIELLNGDIKLHSEENRGTTFLVTLPSK